MTRQKVAVVDDDVPVTKGLKRLLDGRGFETRTYQSAQEFLSALRLLRPDFLIADLQMPGMTGLELHEHLQRRGIKIPTIIITAHTSEEARQRSIATGIVSFLSKPIQPQSLFAALAMPANENR